MYCILSNQFNCLEFLISLCFSSMFCFQPQCLSTWPMSGFPLQKYTHFTTAQRNTNVCVIFQKKLETFARAFFLIVFMLLWKVCASVRNGFTRRRRVFMHPQLCSSLRGLQVTPVWSQGFCGKHARLCTSTPLFLSSPTYFRGRQNDTYRWRMLQDIQFSF